MKFLYTIVCFLFCYSLQGQETRLNGLISGNIIEDEKEQPVSAATVVCRLQNDTSRSHTAISDKNGYFLFEDLGPGYYQLLIEHINFPPYRIDSIHVRTDRSDFNLSDIRLSKKASDLQAVVIYAEKPLIENKDGKITFNVSESATSNSSSATDLLKQTPLVSVDADGKVQLKGKDVKILVDDKPVDMDARQLQDLLESMPGSMIEKIEVLTTPPPQYANERGGVINIVTKKGRVGFNARLNVNYGTRGEGSASGNLHYKKKKITLNFSAGLSRNQYRGNSFSNRQNIYADSSNYLFTTGRSRSANWRPNSRLTLDYEINKKNILGLVMLYNANDNEGLGFTEFRNENNAGETYRYSRRFVNSNAVSNNPAVNFSYTRKGRQEGEQFRVFANFYFGNQDNDRRFFQEYLFPDGSLTGSDSTQQQVTSINNRNFSYRLQYQKPFKPKIIFYANASVNNIRNQQELNSLFMKKPENTLLKNSLLSNAFEFFQDQYSLNVSMRYEISRNFYTNMGLQQDYTETYFDVQGSSNHYRNSYSNLLPFANITRKWENGYNITLSYKRSIQRPGINNLNPSVDYTDPYNTRFGNPYLQPYFADNFDAGAGYWTKKYNINISAGYNVLQHIYSVIRDRDAEGKTYTTWQNLSGRKEYEGSIWGGLTINKKIKTNTSIAWIFNEYSRYDREVKRFRNGVTLNSSMNVQYTINNLFNASGNFAYNRFASPQGNARSNLSMNIGLQHKFFKKNLSVNLNMIDPFFQQENRHAVYGTNYILESFSSTNTRNFKIGLAYNFRKQTKKPVKKTDSEKIKMA